MIDTLDFAKCPLIPAVIQHADTGQVLMLGYMDRAAVARTLELGRVTFFSRSRQTLWTKGETSGHYLTLVDMRADCDHDTLLVRARPCGPTCHLGTVTCFDQAGATPAPAQALAFFNELESTIDQRLAGDSAASYVASLARRGATRVAQKIGEEGVEVALAAATGQRDELLSEAADLVFHLQIALRMQGLGLADVASELAARAARRAQDDGGSSAASTSDG